MNSEKDGMLICTLKKENGKLVHVNNSKKLLYNAFLRDMEEGQTVKVFFDLNKDNGSLVQLAKIHKCIKEIAIFTGHDFCDVKMLVKDLCGLAITYKSKGDKKTEYKSFSVCSKDELGLVIEMIISIGDFIGINFR